MKEYLLYEIREKQGKMNGATIWTLGFVDIDNGEEYACVIDSTYRNYERDGWVEYLHSNLPYGVYTGLKRSPKSSGKKGEQIIHGDAPGLNQTTAYDLKQAKEAYNLVKEYYKPKQPAFGNGLFTFE